MANGSWLGWSCSWGGDGPKIAYCPGATKRGEASVVPSDSSLFSSINIQESNRRKTYNPVLPVNYPAPRSSSHRRSKSFLQT